MKGDKKSCCILIKVPTHQQFGFMNFNAGKAAGCAGRGNWQKEKNGEEYGWSGDLNASF